jgi:hypothetical protein
MKRARLKIINEGDIAGQKTRILLVGEDDEGNEVTEDLTQGLKNTRVSVDLKVGEPSVAQLECICVMTKIDAVLDDLVVRHVGHSRFGRLVWRMKKWWWGVTEVTGLGDRQRTYVS